jgi:hypothetical protein
LANGAICPIQALGTNSSLELDSSSAGADINTMAYIQAMDASFITPGEFAIGRAVSRRFPCRTLLEIAPLTFAALLTAYAQRTSCGALARGSASAATISLPTIASTSAIGVSLANLEADRSSL